VGYEVPKLDFDHATMHPTDLANNVLTSIVVDHRVIEGELILIGHSFGGLVIKWMLRRAQAEENRRGAQKRDFSHSRNKTRHLDAA
jgi:hypothetical protein